MAISLLWKLSVVEFCRSTFRILQDESWMATFMCRKLKSRWFPSKKQTGTIFILFVRCFNACTTHNSVVLASFSLHSRNKFMYKYSRFVIVFLCVHIFVCDDLINNIRQKNIEQKYEFSYRNCTHNKWIVFKCLRFFFPFKKLSWMYTIFTKTYYMFSFGKGFLVLKLNSKYTVSQISANAK